MTDWERLSVAERERQADALLEIVALAREDIRAGRMRPAEDVFARLRARLCSRDDGPSSSAEEPS